MHAPGPVAVLGKVGYGSVVGQYYCDGIGECYEVPRPGYEIAVSVVGGSQGWVGGEEFVGVETHFGY